MFKFSKTVLTLVLLSSVQMVASDERALTGAETVSSLLEKSLLLASDQYGRLSIADIFFIPMIQNIGYKRVQIQRQR